jgi:NADPH:quinone reductase-like Zn-dependent oxidoreductase
MYAVRALGPGGPVVNQQIPAPVPGPGEVVVEVHAAGLTAGELAWPESWPATPGHEISGVVTELGPGVTGAAAGQEVYGLIRFDRDGGAAEYVAAPAADLAAKPASVDHVGAASMALAALTAWQALVGHAQLAPGQHVLVNGGAGGVGSYAVQLGAALGGEVTATASARDARFVAGLGASQVIDYAGPPIDQQVRDVDVVVDTVGGQAMSRCWPVLRPGGIMVCVASPPPEDEAQRHQARAVYFIVEPDRAALGDLAKLADAGKLRATVGRVFPLTDAAAAFDALEHQHIRGKVVLSTRPGPPGAAGT